MKAKPVQKNIGGVSFEDRFAHLQEDSAEALEWQWERDAIAREAARSSPNFRAVQARLAEFGPANGFFIPRKRGSLWIGLENVDGDFVLKVSETLGGPGRTIVTGIAIAEAIGAKVVHLLRLEPSPKGRYAAVGWIADGNPVGQWSVYEIATGKHLLDAGGLLYTGARPGWLPDESGFWLNDRTAEGVHRLRFVPVADGVEARADVELSDALVEARHSGLTLQVAPDGRSGLAVTEPHEHVALVHLDLETLEPRPFLPQGFAGECDGTWIDGQIYVARVNDGAPRGRVVAIPVATSADISTWREIVPEGEGFMSWAGVVANRLYVGDLVDVSLRVRVFDLDGTLIETLPLENPGSSLSTARAIHPTDAFVFSHATFTRSPAIFVHDPETGELRQVSVAASELEGVLAEQRFATSRDGTRVPYFMVYRKDLDLTQPQPALVHAYGGFNMSVVPGFPASFVPLIEAGGVFVQASLRGGAEYGRAWYDAGRLFNKRNTFDDLEAVANALIADGVSAPDRLAFHGASNGGLLAGAAIVFQPHLWRAVAPIVPVFDMMEMLPLTASTAALRAIMYEDYGDTAMPAVAASVIQWSPYHNIADGVAYPAVFQMFGEQDAGCMPFHGRKFTARLEEADCGDRPIHLRVWRNTGHGVIDPMGAAAWNGEWLSFIMDQIGLRAAGADA